MSRTNPYKKRRAAKQTLLMYGEGLGEEMFLKHLRRLYNRDSGVSVIIRKGKGGSPKNVVIGAANEIGGFDNRVAVVDNDKGDEEMTEARSEARNRGINLIEHSPCLEALLLSVLRGGQSFSNRTSAWCKKEFESNYIEKKKRKEISEYEKVLPKTLLDEMRNNVVELDTLISLMENRK